MAELGIIASGTQIADVGLRLSVKLYTLGEIVASADRSVISISKDRFDICRTYEPQMQRLEGTLDLTVRSNAKKKLAPVLKERIKRAKDLNTRPLAASARPTSPPNATIERAFFGKTALQRRIPGPTSPLKSMNR